MKKVLGIGLAVSLAVMLSACTADQKAGLDLLRATPTTSESPIETAGSTQEDESEPQTVDAVQPEVDPANVERVLLENNVVDSFIELSDMSPGQAITEIEAVGLTGIRVHVQEILTDDEKEETARWVMHMACEENPDMAVVVIRDAAGIDSNFYSSRLNILPACQ